MALVSNVLRVKFVIFVVICFVLWQALRTVPSISSAATEEPSAISERSGIESPSPVDVVVFYEALCPDSRNFIIKQLLPTFEKDTHLINVGLVPYGKAQTRVLPGGGYSFTCQHGTVECEANKIHACAIAKVKDKELALKYVSCMISDNLDPERIGQRCARLHGVSWDPIHKCASGSEGNDLLKMYGDDTNALKPGVSFIPTIVINGSQDNQAAILKNLLREVCKKLPDPKPSECS